MKEWKKIIPLRENKQNYALRREQFSSSSSFVCEQFLRDIVYPLDVKAHNILVHQKECIILWCN